MIAVQILIDGFTISTLYALGAVGFTLIYGVSGALNLAHGGLMVLAAMAAWYFGSEFDGSAAIDALVGLATGGVATVGTYVLIVRPIERSKRFAEHERDLFVLTVTLLWGVMIQELLSYFFTDAQVAVKPLLGGTFNMLSVEVPSNDLLIVLVGWGVMGLLWLLVNRTKLGKRLLAASVNARGLLLLGFSLDRIRFVVWAVYGLLVGVSGVLLGSLLGSGPDYVMGLTGSAFTIVVLGGLGSVAGTLIAAFIIGYIETLTAYLVSPALRTVPALLVLIVIMYVRPSGLLGRRP